MGQISSHFYIPSTGPGDWRCLLEKPNLHWKTGRSAKALAYCWEESKNFPSSVEKVFRKSKFSIFQDTKILLAFPEYKVPLPGGTTSSTNDIFILARGNNQLIAITVEGKVSEPFDKPVSEWKADTGRGKPRRLQYLCEVLQLDVKQVDQIYYQLLHRTASAIIEANEFKANNALMLVHSFGHGDKQESNFVEYCRFLKLFGITQAKVDSIVHSRRIDGINLYFGWVEGEPKYLLA
jgi:hypothetical protein